MFDNQGNGYQTASGEFVPPRAGIYQFTIATMNAEPNKEVDLEMRSSVSNGNALCQVYANGNQYQNGVCTRVVRLSTGGRVWVVNPSSNDDRNVYRGRFTSFAGVMVSPGF